MRTDRLVICAALAAGCSIEAPEVVERDCETRTLYYADADGDGYGDPAHKWLACALPEGASENADDCDDADADKGLDCSEDTGDTGGDTGSDTGGDTASDTGDTGGRR